MRIPAKTTAAIILASMAIPLAIMHPLAEYDTLCRYAPMAEAFAEGNWIEAFHPRFGVIFSVLTGTLTWLTGLDGLSSCVAVSTLAWALCIIPLYDIAEKIFDRRTARIAVALYVACPLTLQYALGGLKEPLRTLGLLLMIKGIFSAYADENGQFAGMTPTILGAIILTTLKVDTVLFGGLLLAVFVFLTRNRLASSIAVMVFILSCQFPSYLVYSWTGYWLPAPQYISILQKMF